MSLSEDIGDLNEQGIEDNGLDSMQRARLANGGRGEIDAPAGKFERAARPDTITGSDVQRMVAAIRARLVARYRLVAVPGRSEELEDPRNGKRVSLGYGSRTIRIRRQQGRMWLDCRDLQIRVDSGWHAEVFAYLDPHFEYVSPAALTRF